MFEEIRKAHFGPDEVSFERWPRNTAFTDERFVKPW